MYPKLVLATGSTIRLETRCVLPFDAVVQREDSSVVCFYIFKA